MKRGYNKVIIWGYPLDTHTMGYVYYGFFKAFKHMGYDVYWFNDADFPRTDAFDYSKSVFITEGKCDNNVPVIDSNMYIINACINPYKYIKSGARLVDLRYHVAHLHESVYDYELADRPVDPISSKSYTLYENKASPKELNATFRTEHIAPYEALYMFWATDLLPEEINFEDRFVSPTIPYETTFFGTIADGNKSQIQRYALGCASNGVTLKWNNPWSTPVSLEQVREITKYSVIANDIRGDGDPNNSHKRMGYVGCRIFKNISYGKVGVTNSERIKNLFGEYILYSSDEKECAEIAFQNKDNYDYIFKQMKWVAENHTYINRVQDFLDLVAKKGEFLEKRRPSFPVV
jgi:hypothetical protein